MHRLLNVLRTIFLAGRLSSAHPAQKAEEPEEHGAQAEPSVAVPPPKDSISDEELTAVGEYDPLQEMTAIFPPLHGRGVEFRNIYYSDDHHDFLHDRAEFCLYMLTPSGVRSAGAANELEALTRYLKNSRLSGWLFRVYRVQGQAILAGNYLPNDELQWYYSTALELPEGRFNPRLAYLERPTKSKSQLQKEYQADHGLKHKGRGE